MSKRTEWNPQNCPEWCEAGSKEYPCKGEHRTISSGSYVPASAGYIERSETCDGGTVPVVGVGLYWGQSFGGGQELLLAIDDDRCLNFKPNEALALITEISYMLEAMVVASSISIEDGNHVFELVDNVQSIKDALIGEVA